MMGPGELGHAITVIDGKPQKFSVRYVEVGPSSYDLTNRFPLAYIFDPVKPSDDTDHYDFVVKIIDELLEFKFGGVNHETHMHVTKFALASIRKEPNKSEFIFTTEKFEAVANRSKLSSTELRHGILDLIYRVNEVWPSEEISVNDLFENLNSAREEIEEWGNRLVEEDYLTVGKRSPKPSERAGVSTRSYRINAAKLKEIREVVGSFQAEGGKLKIFLSYSHKDRHVVGKVKTELEERGFDTFLAHDDIEVSEEWKERILEELKSCHVFIPILSGNFEASDWTDQETGHAFANQKVIVPLNLTCNPYGFIGKYQAKPLDENVVSDSCRAIIEALAKRSELASFFNKGSDK